MKLEDTRSAYEALSAKASDIVRQLGFAGIALIWLFKSGTATMSTLDLRLLRAAFFIFLALIFDFLQYLFGTTIWFLYFRRKEKQRKTEQDEFLAPPHINWPSWILFYLKAASMLIAYVIYMIPFLLSKFTEW